MEVRELVVGDEALALDVFRTVLPDSPAALADGPDDAAAFLAEPTSFFLAAFDDDTPVGLAWGMQMRSPSGRLTTCLHELDVSEGRRRRGVGSALVTEAMVIARRCGSTRFWLSTGGHNAVAQALYSSLGGDRKPDGDVNYWWELD